MNRIKSCFFVVLILSTGSFAAPAAADTFGGGANSFDIDFVTIGNPGNPPYFNRSVPTNGAVPYQYRMGKYEISEQMIDKANLIGGLEITKDTRGPDKPATSLTWYEAARFVNWLNLSTGHMAAYKFDATGNFQLWQPPAAAYDAANPYRNRNAFYFLPTIDEWIKAGYFDPVAGIYYQFPTGSNSRPDGIDFVGDPIFDAVFADSVVNNGPLDITNVGLLSRYGTAGQGGNVQEWLETAYDSTNDSATESRVTSRSAWNGGWIDLAITVGAVYYPQDERLFLGFRVASLVPEPSAGIALGTGLIGFCFRYRCRRK